MQHDPLKGARPLNGLWLLLCLCSLAHGKYPPAVQPGAQPYHRAVVQIFASDGHGNIAIGSGVLVAKRGDEGLVLTAWHNVRDGGPYHVAWPGNGGASFEVITHDVALDLAALWVGVPKGVEPIPLSAKLPLSGSTVELAGYGGGRWLASYPTVRGYYHHSRTDRLTDIGLSTKVISGESGGPVITFENRKPVVAGIVWGGWPVYEDKSMEFGQATGSVAIADWMRKTAALRGWQPSEFLQVSVKGGAK